MKKILLIIALLFTSVIVNAQTIFPFANITTYTNSGYNLPVGGRYKFTPKEKVVGTFSGIKQFVDTLGLGEMVYTNSYAKLTNYTHVIGKDFVYFLRLHPNLKVKQVSSTVWSTGYDSTALYNNDFSNPTYTNLSFTPIYTSTALGAILFREIKAQYGSTFERQNAIKKPIEAASNYNYTVYAIDKSKRTFWHKSNYDTTWINYNTKTGFGNTAIYPIIKKDTIYKYMSKVFKNDTMFNGTTKLQTYNLTLTSSNFDDNISRFEKTNYFINDNSYLNVNNIGLYASQTYTTVGYAFTTITGIYTNLAAQPVVTPPSATICQGETSTFSITNAGINFTWYRNNIIVGTGNSFNTSIAGTYMCVFSSTGDGMVLSTRSTLTVNTTLSQLNVTITQSATSVCAGTPVTLSASGVNNNIAYSWSGGVQQGVAFVPTITGTYTVVGTYSNLGCSVSGVASATVEVRPLPVVLEVYQHVPPCTSSTYNFMSVSGSNVSYYTCYNPYGSVVNPSIGGYYNFRFNEGTFTIIGFSNNGCGTAAGFATYSYPPEVNIINYSLSVCAGSPVTLSASGATTYTWSGGAVQDVPFVPTSSGTYTVTGTDANNCTATGLGVATVTVVPFPTITGFAAFSVCQTVSSVNLAATPRGGKYSGLGVANGLFTPSVAGIGGTPITYAVTVGGCAATPVSVTAMVQSCVSAVVTVPSGTITVSGITVTGLVTVTSTVTVVNGNTILGITTLVGSVNGTVTTIVGVGTTIVGTTNLQSSQNLEGLGFEVYPNPTTGTFIISLKSPSGDLGVGVEVYNAIGQHIASLPAGEATLPKGFYLLRYGRSLRKLVVE